MKKLMALLLALVLCVAMACPAFAVEGATDDGADTGFVNSKEEIPPVDPDPGLDDDEAIGPGTGEDDGLGVPETGDQSPESTALLAGLMGLSFVGIVAVSTVLWKNRESNKA